MACPQLGVILAYWKQTGVSSPKNPIALAVGVSKEHLIKEFSKDHKGHDEEDGFDKLWTILYGELGAHQGT